MGTEMRQMGYTAEIAKLLETPRWNPEPDALFTFDSGAKITFADATHHCMVLGTTGTGKTSGVILPMLEALIRGRHIGLIIDIKGNLSAKVYAIAEKHGRTGDILELGTGDCALRLNILANLSSQGVRDFLTDLTLKNVGYTRNGDWHLKGVNWACDCVRLLKWLSELDPEIQPTLPLVAEMLDDFAQAQGLYKIFRERVYDAGNKEHARFVASIENDAFHIFNVRGERRGTALTELESQRTWNLQGIRMGLKSFLEIPALRRNFCAPAAPGLDMGGPLKEGKIILLRFDPDTGPIGARLARYVIREFYAAVFAFGLKRPNRDKKLFILIDEYQEIADISGARYSDASFVAQGREFDASFIACTQSLAAVAAKGVDAASVAAFVANCNQRIFFRSDDPLTQEMAARYRPDLDLKTLKSGQVFAITYDTEKRAQKFGFESCQGAFESTQDLIPINYRDTGPIEPEEQFDLWEVGKILKSPQHRQRKGKMEAVKNDLVAKYPDMFSAHAVVDIPATWHTKAAWALEFFAKSGMTVKISSLYLSGDGMDVELEDESDKAAKAKTYVLRKMLKSVSDCCIICGEERSGVSNGDSDDDDYDYESHSLRRKFRIPYVCEDCQRQAMRSQASV